jgi:hypothetical protein
VIVSAAMGAAPQELSGSIVALIYGANMGVSFLAPVAEAAEGHINHQHGEIRRNAEPERGKAYQRDTESE